MVSARDPSPGPAVSLRWGRASMSNLHIERSKPASRKLKGRLGGNALELDSLQDGASAGFAEGAKVLRSEPAHQEHLQKLNVPIHPAWHCKHCNMYNVDT